MFSISLSSRPVQLSLLTFTLGATTATAILYATTAIRRRHLTEELKASIPELSPSYHAGQLTEYGAAALDSLEGKNESASSFRALGEEDKRVARIAARARRGHYDEALILEQLTRTSAFLTPDGLRKLREAFVVVVGLGGVGSHAVAALARSGVGRIRIVDFDQVTLSSLNRHALATLADVGMPKVHCVRKRLEHIAPWVRIDGKIELFGPNSAEKLLGEWDFELRNGEPVGTKLPDYVIDCIDNIDSKVELLRFCHGRGIRVVSAMGAGCKSDPTRICVGDIATSIEDPLSKATRRRLRILGINRGIPVVFSTEKPGPGKAALLPIAEEEIEKGDVGNLGVLPDFRVRILPVLGTMPAVFGYTAANHVICELAGYPLEYAVGERGREKMYDGMLSALQGCEERLVRDAAKNAKNNDATLGLRIPLGTSDVAYLVEEVFRGHSVVSGLTNRLALVRWRVPEAGFQADLEYEPEGQKSVKLGIGDLVLMTKEEAARHEREVLKGGKAPEEIYDKSVVDLVRKRQLEESTFDRYR